ncbi:hypothetical protein [Pseudoalteromonas sp. PAR1]|uniref:hypothetical protein n=1 Tax=Pseudoalteromonas sp. PAR1 TaxID=2853443 RepID=UPI00248BD081|nr:hypothetical protein [Pseudoalteromonas sp. PAR1]
MSLKKRAVCTLIIAIKLDELKEILTDTANFEMHARRIIERLAQLWQAATLLQFGEPFIADAFVKSRLTGVGFSQYGCLSCDIDCQAIVSRMMPKL